MKHISIKLHHIATASLAALVGIAAVTVSAQEITYKDKEKIKVVHEQKVGRGFCTNNNWSNGDKQSFSELREMTVSASGTISVDGGANGGIKVIGEERADVLVRACVQTWGASDEAARAVAKNIRINTSGTIKAENGDQPHDWSVSYQIAVPRSSNLNLKAKNGGISISGVDGTAEFETLNGGLHLSNLSGNVRGRTTNGGVHVDLAGASWKGTGLDLQTTNGGVHLTIAENYAARIETGTVNGGFHSSIRGLQIEKDPNDRRGHRSSRITTDLNGGGAPIRLITTNGGVHINSRDNE